MSKESPKKVIMVAVVTCLVCSVLVASATVALRPAQERNKALETKKNILQAAGIYTEGMDIDKAFTQVEPRLVDLESGTFSDGDPSRFNAIKASKDSSTNYQIPANLDIAKIRQRAKQALIYLVKKDDQIETVILPIYGKGLWSTLYGFVALAADGNQVKGLTFYEHGETPGLGGEVDNPRWKAQWPGKAIFDGKGNLAVKVDKGTVSPDSPMAVHHVDGLGGATLTTRGVNNLIRYWMGDNGYGPLLKSFKKQGA